MKIRKGSKPDIEFCFDGVSLKAIETKSGDKTVRTISGTASSTAEDTYGDILSPACQIKMLDKLRAYAASGRGMTGWLNHSYKIPEDTLGTFQSASVATRSQDGVEFIDLDIVLQLTDTNPRADVAYLQVQEGVRHGWSIGAYFTDAEWVDPDDWSNWGMIVNDLELMEISLVGLPANQRAWAKSAEDLKARGAELAERFPKDLAPSERREMVMKSIVHTLDDDDQMQMDEAQVRAGMAMDCIESAASHGMCSESAGKIAEAKAHMAAIAGGSATKNMILGEMPTVTAKSLEDFQADVEKAQADLAAVDGDVVKAQAELEKLTASIATATTDLETKTAEIAKAATELADLQAKIDAAKVTPLGRRTATGGEEPVEDAGSTQPEDYQQSTSEIASKLGKQLSGDGQATDARSSATTR